MKQPLAARIGLPYLLASSLAVGSMAIAGCTPLQVATRPMPSMEPLKSDLVRGVSTRADVQRLLGEPSGNGSSVLPPDLSARDVWFYQEVKVEDFKTEKAGSGVHAETYIRANITQKILLVFFKGELYDGYMWYSNAGAVEGKTREAPPGS